ncbi:hypothetical protein RO3G_08118 [Rhizopus delemar RA 99-880]|uniref:Uncharacterized protein n=1 Tax=Rhizopus delemar (strain RA 99-880 / ATCC MYA-4621 / FGSC 9543 / NRRL 43880) TaxID=246409 RepID=I1C4N3_RHIO9|nr:hypothetical protein RO3G_08118 [Rhizopus delemar RA 99-880]|eukprot:EIE83413.1 hypothetical protein RO3G_08118 [Rhizopus delemar RA 99-880]
MFLGSTYEKGLENGRNYHLKTNQVATEYGNYVLDRSSTIGDKLFTSRVKKCQLS